MKRIFALFAGSGALLFVACTVNSPPTVQISEGNVTVNNGVPATFTAVALDANENDAVTLQWYVDNTAQSGATSSTFTVTKSPSVETAYKVKVVARDKVGETAEAEVTLTVLAVSTIAHIDSSGTFVYSPDVGTSARNVYFIFTNTSTENDASSIPKVSSDVESRSAAGTSFRSAVSLSVGTALRGTPAISEYNNHPPSFGSTVAAKTVRDIRSKAPGVDEEGYSLSFLVSNDDGNTFTSLATTCRKAVSGVSVADGTQRRLCIYVADNCWYSGGSKAYTVTQAMVDHLADKFLKTGLANDIYDWATAIYGAEWGTHTSSNLIAPDNTITILLLDIDDDNATDGGVVGYFWAKDNYTTAAQAKSNARIMFYIDAVLYAEPDSGTWEISDYWPVQIVSTLAHEFQHMIHFYQKQVVKGSGESETWLNEMCSEVTEDFVSEKLGTIGPRGVTGSDGTAGSSGNTDGRLPLFTYYDEQSLIDWGSSSSAVLINYSTVYAFGAFLARNFGGAPLFRDIVQNNKSDYTAVEYALAQNGYSGETFVSVLRKWGPAVLLSDRTTAPERYRYNTGGYFESSIGGITYKLGSINMYNYKYGTYASGPYTYTTMSEYSQLMGNRQPKTSNVYYSAGSKTGAASWNITLPSGVKMTAVFK